MEVEQELEVMTLASYDDDRDAAEAASTATAAPRQVTWEDGAAIKAVSNAVVNLVKKGGALVAAYNERAIQRVMAPHKLENLQLRAYVHEMERSQVE